MLVAFWSSVQGQSANTTNAATIGTMMALDNNLKVLMSPINASMNMLEHFFITDKLLKQDRMGAFSDRGIDAVARLARNKKLMPSIIGDYAFSLLKDNRLDLLVGTETKAIDIFENIVEVLPLVIECAKEVYDVVVIDVHYGFNNKITDFILKQADVMVISMSQNIHLLRAFFEDPQRVCFDHKKKVVTIGRYYKDSKLTLRNISRRFGLDAITAVPYHVPLMDACNQSQLLEYIVRNLNSKKNDEQGEFIKTLKATTKTILKVGGYNGV